MPTQMRRAWACPDLGLTKPEGMELPVAGSRFSFPHCPAYSLRTAADDLPADHLVGGQHPANLIAPVVGELQAGAVRHQDLPPRVVELARLWATEQDSRREHEQEQRRGS